MAEMLPIPHSDDSIRAAAEEFLDYLGVYDEPDRDGYFEELPSRKYFRVLHDDDPGSWDALIRNMQYGLDRFPRDGCWISDVAMACRPSSSLDMDIR